MFSVIKPANNQMNNHNEDEYADGDTAKLLLRTAAKNLNNSSY